MDERIGISIRIPKSVRDGIAESAKKDGRSMSKQIAMILSKESNKFKKLVK